MYVEELIAANAHVHFLSWYAFECVYVPNGNISFSNLQEWSFHRQTFVNLSWTWDDIFCFSAKKDTFRHVYESNKIDFWSFSSIFPLSLQFFYASYNSM